MSEPRVPLFDLRLSEDEVAAVAECLRSGWLTMGPRTAAFEQAFAARVGARHAIAVSSCTAALHLAYLAAGVRPGDEVIVPAMTFVATAAAARYCGAVPVVADILGEDDFSLDPASVARLITPRTRAIAVVHFAGYPADVAALREFGLPVIEDSAHTPVLGPSGLASAYSFFSNKVLSCGEGGLVATDSPEVAEVARRLRSHAMTTGTWDRHRGHATEYDVTGTGFNYRLDEPRAALLLARLAGLDADVARRRELVRGYRARLADVPGVSVPYSDDAVAESACYVMPVLVESERDAVRAGMLLRWGAQTSVLYRSVTELTAYAAFGSCPRAEDVAARELTLPLYPHLSEADMDLVVEALAAEVDESRSAAAA
jgi:dTDP-4-amino-4,6-dideoxygalactose transaminase